MATPKQTAAGTWRVQIEVRGQRDAATLPSKRAAAEWAARRQAELLALNSGRAGEVKTLADALKRYAEEVSPTKRGHLKELARLKAFPRQPGFPATRRLAEITPAQLAEWRDARLRVNARGTVLRGMLLLSHVLEVARREWGWLTSNPAREVRKPAAPAHRERVIAIWEIRRLLRVLGWSPRKPARGPAQAVAHCFVAALQTGMRAGELCGLRWADVHADYVTLHTGATKSGRGREVPLLPTARRTLACMRGYDEEFVFGLRSSSLDSLFRNYRQRAGLAGFTFHDARHSAATRLARRLDVLDLCKMFGWRSATLALVYYNPTGSQLAQRLTAAAAPTPPVR